MIPSNIEKEHIIKAIQEIDLNGIPVGRESRKFRLIFEGKEYSPKYILSLANKFANGEVLNPSRFTGGQETNNFLKGLGFDIEEISSSKTIDTPISSQKKIFEKRQKRHDERCPECKKTIEEMLKKIYENVESNCKFEVNTNFEDYKVFPFYQKLKEIFLELQKNRGYNDFVRVSSLPRCDFFVPNPGFIVEFDESQHFTFPRKISLQNYPQNLKLGFSAAKWIDLCEKINAKDNDPPFRDEQRAWYDTLRDLLPEIKGLQPTVRFHSEEMQWCSLNTENQNDIEKFRKLIENRQKRSSNWIAVVVLQSNKKYSNEEHNEERLKVLSQIVDTIAKETEGEGVVLFPGGWFHTNYEKPSKIYDWVENGIKSILCGIDANIIVCAGIDGGIDEAGYWHDQIAIAVSKNDINAMGRKFYPTSKEKKHVELAENYLDGEDDKSRIFELNGVKYFMCVCYDSFGIRHKNFPNPNTDIILNLVHCFYPRSKGPSGNFYFARDGFARASKQWSCPVFGTAVFFNRDIPERWPSGVYCNQDSKSMQKWRYEDNPIKSQNEFKVSIKEGAALVRIYNIEGCEMSQESQRR